MTFHNLPIPLLELIKRYEVTKPPYIKGNRGNFLITNLTVEKQDDRLMLHGTMGSPDLKDVDYMMWFRDSTPNYRQSEPITLVAPCNLEVLTNVTEVFCFQGQFDQIQPCQASIDDQSLLVPWSIDRHTIHHSTWMMEPFAGGFGGWTFAKKFLMRSFPMNMNTIAIESHLPFATQFALNHGFNLIGDASGMKPNFISKLNQDVMIVERIQDANWQKQIQTVPLACGLYLHHARVGVQLPRKKALAIPMVWHLPRTLHRSEFSSRKWY